MVVAATAHELAIADDWRSILCGVGPVEAAAVTAAAIAEYRPNAIVHVGIAGARRHLQLVPATLVIGSASRYCDLHVPAAWATSAISSSPMILEAMQRALPDARALTIGTSARVGGTSDCDVESMEGFGVLRAAQLAGVPAIEIRAISNDIEETDRTRWHFALAFAAITAVTPALVQAVQRCVTRRATNA